jgi:hypothetical protein
MAKEDIEIVIGADDRASKVIDSVSNRVGMFGSSVVSSLGPAAAALGGMAAAYATLNAIVSGVSSSSQRIDELADTAKGLGESVSNVELFQQTMERLGNVSPEKSIDALQKIQKLVGSISTGENAAGAELFEKLELDASKLRLDGPLEQFKAIQQAIAAIENPSERAAVAQQLLGKSAAQLLPALVESSDEFRKIEQRIAAITYKLSAAEVDGIGGMNDAIGEAGLALQSIYDQLAAELAPVIETIALEIVDWYLESKPFINESIPALVEGMALAAGFAYDFARFWADVATINVRDIADMMGGDSTAMRWVDDAAIRRRSRELDALLAQKAELEKPASVGIDESGSSADKVAEQKANASDKVIEQLMRQLSVLEHGEDVVRKMEQLMTATTDAERADIELLQGRIAEEQARIEAEKEAKKKEDERVKQEEAERKKQDDEILRKAQALAEPPPTLQAKESRLLTRGDTGQDQMKMVANNTKEAAEASKRTAKATEKLADEYKSPGEIESENYLAVQVVK